MQASMYKRAVTSLVHRGMLAYEQRPLCSVSTTTAARTFSGLDCFLVNQTSRATLRLHKSLQLVHAPRRQFCEKTGKVVAPAEGQAARSQSPEQITQVASSATHQHFGAKSVSNFDKKLLVYFGKYKTVGEVPDLVSVHMMNATRNKFRVYVNIFIGFLTMAGCIFMIYRGHSRAGTGETLADHNMKRHPEHYRKQLKD